MSELGEGSRGGWDGCSRQVRVGVGGQVCGQKARQAAGGGRHGGGYLRALEGLVAMAVGVDVWCSARSAAHGGRQLFGSAL
jgi:hypothetical protein